MCRGQRRGYTSLANENFHIATKPALANPLRLLDMSTAIWDADE
jgi:hypothetical protein